MLTGSEIRRKFLDYFVQHGHREVHSSSLVPANDPTLLFTNAGMNQFKDVFLGLEKRDYSRATTSQKCVRAGGKHNDLENVGFTNRHHTFFEMLGNFSFGDYFKKDAIAYAWELITSPEWFGIPKDKLYATIFNGEGGMSRDAEAYDLWLAQGVAKDRIFEFGLKDNFWQMGDTGPCGPCSEIHYDMGPSASDQEHADCAFGCDCGRYVEIWNLVFMQFDRDAAGKLNPLPKPSIDTGMGLERLTAVLQGVISNYDTDLFVPLIKRAAELTNAHVGADALVRPAEQSSAASSRGSVQESSEASLRRTDEGVRPHVAGGQSAGSLRVIADHSRAATFLISDGVLPANDGRGYVLRKIIRRAIRHARQLGAENPVLTPLVDSVCQGMRDAYPELRETKDRVKKILIVEEERFDHTLRLGWEKYEDDYDVELQAQFDKLRNIELGAEAFQQSISDLPREQRIRRGLAYLKSLPDPIRPPLRYSGEKAFKLYDTFGLPLDFMVEAARDQGIEFDIEGFDSAMAEQKSRARASWKGAAKQTANPAYQKLPKSEFEGYRQTRSNGCEVLAIIKAGEGTRELRAGEEGEVILDHTPFYAESGGQVGDRGWLYSDDHNTVVAEVKGCYYPVQGVRAHQVVVKGESKSPPYENRVGWGTRPKNKQGVPHPSAYSAEGGSFDFTLRVGDKVDAVVNTDIRQATMRNHTATHLLQAGLREVLGKHVKQAGSLVAPNHLRFDFSHFTGVADEELQDIEDLINKEVLRNQRVEVIPDVPIDVAINEYKAMALFGEKYGDRVRVIKIGDFSTELCGGTHTEATGEIGLIKVLKEGSVSSGIRRIEAVTGEGSLHHFQQDHQLENVVASFVGPTLSQRTRKDGAPSEQEAIASPAEALKVELDKKDSEIKRLQRELNQARMKSASSTVASATGNVKEVRGVKVLAHRVDNLERQQMRTLVDQLRDKLGSGVVVLGSATNGSVALIVSVTKDLTSKLQAGKIIGPVAQRVGGKGGGRPDMAEAGGNNPQELNAALGDSYAVVESLLK